MCSWAHAGCAPLLNSDFVALPSSREGRTIRDRRPGHCGLRMKRGRVLCVVFGYFARSRKLETVRENEPAFRLAWTRRSWHCLFHAEGQPDADAEGKPEADRRKTRPGSGNGFDRRNHRKVGRGESPAAPASADGPKEGCELRLIAHTPLAEWPSQRLKDLR